MQNEDPVQEHYSFLKETIKPAQISKARVLRMVLKFAFLGLVFGVFACFSFFAIRPWMEGRFTNETTQPIIIIQGDGDTLINDGGQDDAGDEMGPNNVDDAISPDAIENIPGEMIASPSMSALEEHQALLDVIYEVAQQAERSTVTVRGATAENEPLYENLPDNSTIGIILFENEEKLLILTASDITNQFTNWAVTFVDGSIQTAYLRSRDHNIGLAILEIPRDQVAGESLHEIEVATLGNSSRINRGEMVIGLGNFTGHGDEISYGAITSIAYNQSIPDRTISMLATDIHGNRAANGVLFNSNGELIGIVLRGVGPTVEGGSISAIAISDVQGIIEHLLNGIPIPYLGIYGITVTDEIAAFHDVPGGLYVMQVVPDSPAMQAGIQRGDIITQIEEDTISTTLHFERSLLNLVAGQEVRINGQRLGAEGYVDIEFIVHLSSRNE